MVFGCHDLRVTLFETILGLPLHPLAIHAAVVLVPLLVVAGVAYAVVPRLRGRIGWATVLLALVSPLCALAAKLSGDAFRARLARHGASDGLLAQVDAHRHFGTFALYFTVALAVAVLVLVVLRNSAFAVQVTIGVVTIVLAGVAAYYVYRTGDSGARIVWGGS